jgi:branched-chain amino acid transport system substrate-binding protein
MPCRQRLYSTYLYLSKGVVLMRKFRVVGAALLAVAATAMAGCSFQDKSSNADGYQVGLILDQTGVSSQIAGPTGAGIKAYLEKVNADGGVNGTKITISKQSDSRSDANGAQSAFQEVLQTEPLAILGSVNSLGIAAAVPVMSGSSTPVMIGSAPDTLMVPPKPWLFTQVMPAASMMSASLDYLDEALDGLEGKRLAVSAAASAYGDAYVDAFNKEAEARGFSVATVDRSSLTLTTFATNAAKIVHSDADALLLLDVPSQTGLIVDDLVAAGFENPIVGYESASEPAILSEVATKQYVSFRGAPVPAADSELAKAAKDAGFEDQANSLWFSYGWNEAAMFVDALDACGEDCTSSDLMAELENVSDFTPPAQSSYGALSYTADRHFAATSVQFYTYDPSANAEEKVGDPISVG